MARKRNRESANPFRELKHETKLSIFGIVLIGLAILLFLSSFDQAGPIGNLTFSGLSKLFGIGYYIIPTILLIVGFFFIFGHERKLVGLTLIGATLLIFASLGTLDILYQGHAGLVGNIFGSLYFPFGYAASLILNVMFMLIAIIITFNVPLRIRAEKIFAKKDKPTASQADKLPRVTMGGKNISVEDEETEQESEEDMEETPEEKPREDKKKEIKNDLTITKSENKTGTMEKIAANFKNYVPPPLTLLKTSSDKPSAGDLRANANIIKRTLESFGIPVEMGEITIGPKVTRYTLKPAEGVKLNKITALNQDLALALAAHPIRIEAPIPGKSLVGIEIPNKTSSIVRLGSLLSYAEFASSSAHLMFALGRDVAGEPIFGNLAKMPHMLVAGTTGSGKSVMIHSLIVSLIYKNSPETMRLILIDPKRVELSVYEGIPHLLTPVITDGKKSIAALRFAIEEMDRRYNTLLKAGKRDIGGFNESSREKMPYMVIVIDELADLMVTFGREVENSIVRLAQMARATGIHLVLSTQRPSVDVITGLIKANISSRVALQVASQVDSRTILDTAGAEKLLGAGDMLFISNELSKPKRIQCSFISSEEISSVVDFITDKNPQTEGGELETKIEETLEKKTSENGGSNEDDMYDEAVEIVREAQKASASLLQRRLKVGYARAARLLDIMEEQGVIGPGEGAKPREVFLEPKSD